MKLLITGANGFIGTSIIKSLQKEYTVVAQVREKNKASNFNDFIEIDINANSNWLKRLQGVNVVIHLAAVAHNKSIDQSNINEVNVKGTVNLAEQAVTSGVKRFIFISSIGVLGNKTTTPFDENTPEIPHSGYAESKLQAEKELLRISEKTGLEVVIIRPVLVYGLGAPGSFGKLVNLVQKTPFLPFALCENKRSFISIDNLVDFIGTCIQHPKAANEIFCISDGYDVSIQEFTNEIATGLNKKLIQLPVPVCIFKFLGKITDKSEQIDQLIGDLQVNSSKSRELLDWTPPVSMAETFRKLSDT